MAINPAPYQLTALTKLLVSRAFGILLADGVGVGKTISAGYILSWLHHHEGSNVVVVTPPSLVDKWRGELRGKFDISAHTISSREELATAQSEQHYGTGPSVYILPYSRLGFDLTFPFEVLIIDEIHNFRNRETQRWGHARKLALEAEFRIGLSATPINNSITDLASIFSILFPTYHPYAIERVVDSMWRTGDFSKLTGLMTRFEKKELGVHFTERVVDDREIVYDESYVRSARRAILDQSEGASAGGFPFGAITLFRAAASSPAALSASLGKELTNLQPDPKLWELRSVIQAHDRALVFVEFKETARYIEAHLDGLEVYVLTGDTPVFERSALIEGFREAEPAVLVLTSVGSEGLDLQFCDAVVNYDLHWNPMKLEQRTGRIDRVGQKSSKVFIYNFVVRGSIDERILQVIDEKLGMLSGTPLYTGQVSSGDSRTLYSTEVFESEHDRASQLATSMTMSARLRIPDHEITDSFIVDCCYPDVLRQQPPLGWVRNTPSMKGWRDNVVSKSEAFFDTLNAFDKLA